MHLIVFINDFLEKLVFYFDHFSHNSVPVKHEMFFDLDSFFILLCGLNDELSFLHSVVLDPLDLCVDLFFIHFGLNYDHGFFAGIFYFPTGFLLFFF
jgi:hypothetical protein